MKHVDKLLHFLVGFFIATTSCLFMPWGFAFILVFITATGKEIHDYFRTTGFNFLDLLATLIGGLFGILISLYS